MAGGEGGSEHVAGEAADVHHHAGVELDVGVEVTAGLQLGQQVDHRLLDGQGQLDQGPAERRDHGTQQERARVVGLVDAVAEAHDPVTLLDGLPDVGLGPVRRADVVEHVEDPAGSTTVQRPRQGTDRAHNGRSQIGPGRGDDPAGEGGRVEPVVDGEDHVLLEGPDVQLARHGAGDHVEVVGHHAEISPGRHRFCAVAQPMGRGQNGRHHGA